MAKLNVLVTSGGTISKIDDVRHIGNFSNGTTGTLIAEEFLKNKAKVYYFHNTNAVRPFRKEFFLTIIGGIIVISPRIIFDFRNNFLISKSLINFFKKPPVYGESLSLLERVTQRLSLFFGFFSSTFTNKNNLFAALFLLTLLIIFLFILKNKKNLNLLKRDYLLRYLVFLLFFIFLAFSIFKDRIWDYYLVGIPITFIIIVAIISNYFFKLIKYKIFVISMLTFITILNFNSQLLSPFKITWLGGGSDFRNQKLVMDYIVTQSPHDYSIYVYTTTIFDYPFDYLINWYTKKGFIEVPKERQNLMYLVIRQEDSIGYPKAGWYGDKTRDNTQIIDTKEFPGDLKVEKHIKLK